MFFKINMSYPTNSKTGNISRAFTLSRKAVNSAAFFTFANSLLSFFLFAFYTFYGYVNLYFLLSYIPVVLSLLSVVAFAFSYLIKPFTLISFNFLVSIVFSSLLFLFINYYCAAGKVYFLCFL